MAKTIHKNHIMENLYIIRENLENSVKALDDNDLAQARSENTTGQKNLRYLISLVDQATNIL